MQFNNPIPRSGLPRFNEASAMRSPRDGDATARMWQKNRTATENIARVANAVEQMQKNFMRLRRRKPQEVAAVPYPFKVFLSPPDNGGAPEEDGYWRTFRVRAGAYGTTAVAGTDGADTDPDDGELNPNDEFSNLIDIVVPDATAAYYIWVDASTPSAPVIDHGSTIPGGGTDADWWGGTFFLIAKIDTSTKSSSKVAVVRQFIRYDIPKCA
jgi:hypothetical protein